MFELPETYIASTTGMLSQLSADLSGLIALTLGIAIGFWLINKFVSLMIGTVRKR